jgi:cob(I)alamin adenosyltransferase
MLRLTAMPRIYTKTGDDGTTGLLYGGRVSKADDATEAYGTVDEAVAALGVARAACGETEPDLAAAVLRLQRDLFVVGADLATNPDERDRLVPEVSLVTPAMTAVLESEIDRLVEAKPLPNAFVVPGANSLSAALDVARSVVRRAERRVVELESAGRTVNADVRRYLNRLSDLLFVLARSVAGDGDVPTREGPSRRG